MSPARRFRCLVFAVVCLLSFTGLLAQEPQKLTLETMNDPSLRQALATPRTWWLDDNTAIIYDTRKPPAEQPLERLDPETGKRTPLLDQKKAAESFKSLFAEGKAPRFSPVPNAFSSSSTYGVYLIDGDIYLLDKHGDGFGPRLEHTDNDYSSASTKIKLYAKVGLGDIKVSRA